IARPSRLPIKYPILSPSTAPAHPDRIRGRSDNSPRPARTELIRKGKSPAKKQLKARWAQGGTDICSRAFCRSRAGRPAGRPFSRRDRRAYQGDKTRHQQTNRILFAAIVEKARPRQERRRQVGAVEGRLSASSLVMEILMACGYRFVLLAFNSKAIEQAP